MCHKPWHHAKVTGREVRFARAPTSSSVSGGAKRGAERATPEKTTSATPYAFAATTSSAYNRAVSAWKTRGGNFSERPKRTAPW